MIVYWLLPTLLTILLLMSLARASEEPIENWDSALWIKCIAISLVFPVGLCVCLGGLIDLKGHVLTKERKLW